MNDNTTEPIIEEQRQQVETIVTRAGAVSVTDAATNADAARMLSLIKGRAKELDDLRKSMTRPLDESKRRIMDMFRPVEQQLADAEQHIKGAMLEWDRAERRRLEAERAAAEAERQRLAAEASRATEEGRYTDAVVAAEDSLNVPEPQKAPQRARGTSVADIWHAEVIDLQALVLAVATGEAPLNLITINQPAINALARATKQEGVVLPGVRFWREANLRANSANIR